MSLHPSSTDWSQTERESRVTERRGSRAGMCETKASSRSPHSKYHFSANTTVLYCTGTVLEYNHVLVRGYGSLKVRVLVYNYIIIRRGAFHDTTLAFRLQTKICPRTHPPTTQSNTVRGQPAPRSRHCLDPWRRVARACVRHILPGHSRDVCLRATLCTASAGRCKRDARARARSLHLPASHMVAHHIAYARRSSSNGNDDRYQYRALLPRLLHDDA